MFCATYVIVIFRAIKLQITVINRSKRKRVLVLVLSTGLPSLVSPAIARVLARMTPSSMLGMSRRHIVFDLQLGRSTSDRNIMGL